jgi:hypothetical protein
MRGIGIFLLMLLTASLQVRGQNVMNLKINEVMICNKSNYVDEYGRHSGWIELANTSFSTINASSLYLTTNRAVLNESLSVPERVKLMSPIPKGEARTMLKARQHILFYCDGHPNRGVLHLSSMFKENQPNWIALYDANGVTLLDSVTVPVLAADFSYAREHDGADKWETKTPDCVTPGIGNFISANGDKIAKFKREDPHGIGMTVIAMGIVFCCLILLYLFFRMFGKLVTFQKKLMRIRAIKSFGEVAHTATVLAKDGLAGKGVDKEIYMAVIAMAIQEYEEDVHDMESNIITIKLHSSNWGAKRFDM